jgi:hypothetical protein
LDTSQRKEVYLKKKKKGLVVGKYKQHGTHI